MSAKADIRAEADRIRALFEAQARPLVEQGVDVLIPGGGIPMLLFSQLNDHRVEGAPDVLVGVGGVAHYASASQTAR